MPLPIVSPAALAPQTVTIPTAAQVSINTGPAVAPAISLFQAWFLRTRLHHWCLNSSRPRPVILLQVVKNHTRTRVTLPRRSRSAAQSLPVGLLEWHDALIGGLLGNTEIRVSLCADECGFEPFFRRSQSGRRVRRRHDLVASISPKSSFPASFVISSMAGTCPLSIDLLGSTK
jgi:hypothetical protein